MRRRKLSLSSMDRCARSSRKSLGLEIKMMKTEAKRFFKWSRSNSRHDQIQTERWPPPISPSDLPPGGNKRAFLCGVTYKKQKCELKGVAHDLRDMKNLLVNEFSFPLESILILAEDESYVPPTKENIKQGFQWLVKGIQPNISLVFYFSGHGVRQRDFVRDEIDGFDETICPLDFETNGNIVDNYINEVLVRPLIKDVTLHAIVDCCHSGTILDLPHVYNMADKKWNDNSPPSGAYKGAKGGKAICFSACEDYQLAADTSALSSEKEMNGAMTCAFITAINTAPNFQEITYSDILYSMHEILKQAHKPGSFFSEIFRVFHRRILQDPLLSSTEEFGIATTKFKL